MALVAVLVLAPGGSSAAYLVNAFDDAPDANLADGICATATGSCTLRAAVQPRALRGCRFRARIPFGTLLEVARYRHRDTLPPGTSPQLPPPPQLETTTTTTTTTAPPPTELPDLVIDSLSTFSFAVPNIGKAPAGPFVVTVSGVGSFNFNSLAAGDKANGSWKSCKPDTITATADPKNQVNESNNSRSFTIKKS